jgi:hypothetical protein
MALELTATGAFGPPSQFSKSLKYGDWRRRGRAISAAREGNQSRGRDAK